MPVIKTNSDDDRSVEIWELTQIYLSVLLDQIWDFIEGENQKKLYELFLERLDDA